MPHSTYATLLSDHICVFAYLRESDVVRVKRAGAFSASTVRNPYSDPILALINEPKPWVGRGWRHYMWWFADFEARATKDIVRSQLRSADSVWRDFEVNDVLMEERRNDGAWVRQWRRAVAEFDSP